jgi:FKBP-type peptidyl-prolyl cis-trans isomerase
MEEYHRRLITLLPGEQMRIQNDSGLQYEDLKEAEGPIIKEGTIVSIQYELALTYDELDKGELVDSSYQRRVPLNFVVGKGSVIKGVDEGILLMRVGGLRRLIIPPHLAFGERGVPGAIPSNATLFVDIKVRDIVAQ